MDSRRPAAVGEGQRRTRQEAAGPSIGHAALPGQHGRQPGVVRLAVPHERGAQDRQHERVRARHSPRPDAPQPRSHRGEFLLLARRVARLLVVVHDVPAGLPEQDPGLLLPAVTTPTIG
ncbi:hypothetical protein ACIBCA_29160 [Kitasatospora sp. NPDC051170]|uniref:hypothetical protein n=1 Tax=Kitasatospora sp. NPDC051170 TaxID=3364056 RepID=UPI0037BCA4C8